MGESKKLIRRVYCKEGRKSRFFKKSQAVWDERVDIICDGETREPKYAEYLFLRANPILRDGYKYEIDEALEREGWECAGGWFTYREKIPCSQLPECIAFKEAYQETYESIIEEAAKELLPSEQRLAIFADHPYTVSQFLEMVKKRFEELKKKMPKIEQKGTGFEQLREVDGFLVAQGFELYRVEWDEEDQEEV